MRQKFVFVTAIAVCLSLALVPALASGRTVDRSGDRTKAAKGQSATGVVEPEFSEQTRQIPANSRLSGSNTVANKAAAMLAAAAKQDGDAAIATLQGVITMDLESTDQNDRIRSTAHELLAGSYIGSPAKQVMHLGMALQYAADPARRAGLETQITALGGDVFSVAFTKGGMSSYTTRDPGPDDSCLGAVAVTLPHSETMSIFPSGDHNWRSFDVPGPDGIFARIETISDFPGTLTDDTDLTLWDDCPSNGGSVIAFNDDKPGEFTSRIDTDCLGPGTYYVEVGGFFDLSTPDNFDLEIEETGTCEVPVVDGFEPDDDRGDDLADIGKPTHANGNGWGRVKKENQSRSIFPLGDIDHATYRLTQNELVRMGTKGTYPTFFNDFQGSSPFDDPDTVLTLLYENEPDYGGRCNQPDLGFLPVCFSDDDCPDPLDNPLPGLPPCIPIQLFTVPVDFENPLAENDDRGGGSFGSELLMCMPRTQPGTGSLTLQQNGGEWLVRVEPFSGSDSFEYELSVRNEVGCLYETEPNNSFLAADPYEIGTVVSGHYDFVVTNPYSDADLYSFDVDVVSTLAFQTFAPDVLQSDTALDLYVGPDDDGDFFYTGVSDEDGGTGFLSRIDVILPPASDLLGNVTADADYIMNVTSNYYNPNYYYDFASADFTASAAVAESEPNDTIGSANTFNVGSTVIAQIGSDCDVDTYRFTLGQSTYITLGATAGGDTAINLVECGTEQSLTCDDDSAGSGLPEVSGCLPAGDYCAQVRAFSAGDQFAYEIQLNGTGGCEPVDPPQMNGDNSFTCLDFASCP